MKCKHIACLLLVSLFASLQVGLGQVRMPVQPQVIVPQSSVEKPSEIGRSAHTNHLILATPGQAGTATPTGETAASLGCVYQISGAALSSGCPRSTTAVPTGGSGTIAVVDAYDYPTAEADLNTFSTKMGLPACTTANGCFQVIYESGSKPTANCSWAQETALDLQWAHAMAPGAKIVLVETDSNSFTDLMEGVDLASQAVVGKDGTGSGEVAMSWGSSEFNDETELDSHFTTNGVVYVAASGDVGGKLIYPAASPNVVAAGGTTINRDGTGNFASESGWEGSGGGKSKYESRPTYQDSISHTVGGRRGAPDFSFDADPTTGVSAYDSTACQQLSGWLVFGGTSVAAPALAGIINLSGSFYTRSELELSTIYSNMSNAHDFRDIRTGSAGRFRAKKGWDFVTGVGSNLGTTGK